MRALARKELREVLGIAAAALAAYLALVVSLMGALVFVGYGPRQRAAVEALGPRRVEVAELNLEDAFIEYTRGPRRSLPLFATGKVDGKGGHGDAGVGAQGAA